MLTFKGGETSVNDGEGGEGLVRERKLVEGTIAINNVKGEALRDLGDKLYASVDQSH